MKTEQVLHPIKLKPPFYQEGGQCGLHRYLDAEFINRFKQDMQRRQFDLPQFNAWQQEERHSRHGQQPVLRLPLHRAFHIVSCEVVCDRFGEPALDPQKNQLGRFRDSPTERRPRAGLDAGRRRSFGLAGRTQRAA